MGAESVFNGLLDDYQPSAAEENEINSAHSGYSAGMGIFFVGDGHCPSRNDRWSSGATSLTRRQSLLLEVSEAQSAVVNNSPVDCQSRRPVAPQSEGGRAWCSAQRIINIDDCRGQSYNDSSEVGCGGVALRQLK